MSIPWIPLALAPASPQPLAAGADSGTLLLDIDPAPAAHSLPGPALVLDSIAVFAADDGVHGIELWTTVGTRGGRS